MDPNSVIGLVVALVGIVGGQALEGGRLGSLFQLTAFVIVFMGTVGAVLVQSPMPTFKDGLRLARWAMRAPVFDRRAVVAQIVQWSQIARREGLLGLEKYIGGIPDLFLRRGLQMVVDGIEPERMRAALEVEIATVEAVRKDAARIWESAGGYAPTIGILGAVLGLIHVMENLSDPSKLGGGIAVAFVATIYGVALANLVFLPIAGKLKLHIAAEVQFREVITDGLLGIANGENPRVIESRLSGYLH
jgi:chemotaxis protein MotA